MQDDILEVIQPTPSFQTNKCKLLVKTIEYALKTSPLLFALISFFLYDIVVAFVALAFSYLIIGIIRAKLRILSIPHSQLELNYDDFAIASWYASQYLCFENLEKNNKSTPL